MWHWTNYARDMMNLGVDARRVIDLRMAKLRRGGPAAAFEAMLMVNEKMIAAGEASLTLAAGGSPQKVVQAYRKKIKGNIRRLSQKRR